MGAPRYAATVSYDGTDFAGSQLQPGVRTVQGELEDAVHRLFGLPVRASMAGRTDAGVHAVGQVMAFSVETQLDETTIGRALNALLPADVAVRSVRAVPEGFDPRRNARRRWYRYTILQGEARDPLLRRTTWHIAEQLHRGAMERAAAALSGSRDFRACSGPLGDSRTPVRTVFRADWHSSGCVLKFDIEANAFLPQMVRRLVGALVRVGRGSLDCEEFAQMLLEGRPATIGPVAPASGLCLQRVWYDEGYVA